MVFWGAAMHGSIFAWRIFVHDLPPMDGDSMNMMMNQSMAFRTIYLTDHPDFVFWRWVIAATTAPLITANVLDRIFKTKEEKSDLLK